MKTAIAQSSWLPDLGFRLDAGPYVGEGNTLRRLLRRAHSVAVPLDSVTLNGKKGIFNGPRFSRIYIPPSDTSVPFLGSTDILSADIRNVPHLARTFVQKFPELVIREDWTLITCSGTVGRMAFTRPDMAGKAGSQHFLRVVPDQDAINPGYLYAYLSCKYGVGQVVGLTYGAVVQHLEPIHICDLIVLVAPHDVQSRVGSLISEAARLRADASRIVGLAVAELESSSGLHHLAERDEVADAVVTFVLSSELDNRFDARYHGSYHRSVRVPLAARYPMGSATVASHAEIIEPPRFKRRGGATSDIGIPFLTTGVLHHSDPIPNQYLFPDASVDSYRVDQNTVLVPRSGQISGILGEVVLPHSSMLAAAISEDAIRIKCSDRNLAGFLYLALTSEYGRRQLKSVAFGSSIPHLNPQVIGQVLVPRVGSSTLTTLGSAGQRASMMRTIATAKEADARNQVEAWIEQECGSRE